MDVFCLQADDDLFTTVLVLNASNHNVLLQEVPQEVEQEMRRLYDRALDQGTTPSPEALKIIVSDVSALHWSHG